MNGGKFRATSVRSWLVSGAGYSSSALVRRSRRMCSNDTSRPSRRAARRVKSEAGTNQTTREVGAGSAQGRGPNKPLQRIAARWRFCPKLKGSVWAARAEGGR